jgi:hypothetical protein
MSFFISSFCTLRTVGSNKYIIILLWWICDRDVTHQSTENLSLPSIAEFSVWFIATKYENLYKCHFDGLMFY